MTILIVGNDIKVSRYLQQGLEENCMVVDVVENSVDALCLSISKQYGLIVFNVPLAAENPWEFISILRQNSVYSKILCIIPKEEVEVIISGIHAGVNDYLIKPVEFSEFLTRVQVLLKRDQYTNSDNKIKILDLEIDFDKHVVTRGKNKIDLTPKEFILLGFLAERKNAVICRTVISEKVWDINFDCHSNVVDVTVRRLRAKIDDAYPQKLIHTIRGVGYVLRDE